MPLRLRCGDLCHPGARAVITANALRPGIHLNMLGADGPGKAEAKVAAVQRCVLFCDEWNQASHGGELTAATDAGAISRAQVTGLGSVLTGGRRAAVRAGHHPLRLHGTGDPGPGAVSRADGGPRGRARGIADGCAVRALAVLALALGLAPSAASAANPVDLRWHHVHAGHGRSPLVGGPGPELLHRVRRPMRQRRDPSWHLPLQTDQGDRRPLRREGPQQRHPSRRSYDGIAAAAQRPVRGSPGQGRLLDHRPRRPGLRVTAWPRAAAGA